MGNSVSQMEFYSNVIEGNLEKGNDALIYSWDKHKESSLSIHIKEHLSNGSTVIYQNYASVGLATRERGKKGFENEFVATRPKSEIKGRRIEASSLAPKESMTSSKKMISDMESRGTIIQTLHQDVLIDVVFAIRPILISYLSSNVELTPPSEISEQRPRRSVSFNLGEIPRKGLPFFNSGSSSGLKAKGRSSLRIKFRDSTSKTGKDDDVSLDDDKVNICQSESSYQYNSISDSQIIDIISTLKRLFNVDEFSIIQALEKAQKREIPKKRFNIEVVEARRLRNKSSKDAINPYCLARIVSNTDSCTTPSKSGDEIFRSNVIHCSLEPLWNGKFNIDSDNSDINLCFEVWHSPLEKGLADKIHIKGLKKETKNLVGYAFLNLKNLKDKKNYCLDSWLKLIKIKQKETVNGDSSHQKEQKERGEIRVRVNEINDVHLTHRDKQNFRSILYAIAQAHASQIQQGSMPFWCGSLSSTETLLIESYCKAFSISSRVKSCSWWLVLSSEEISISQKFLFSLVQDVVERLGSSTVCEEKEGEELAHSVISWISLQITKIKTLQTFYPPTSEVNSKSQLTFSLRTLRELEERIPSSVLNKTVHPFNLCISEALDEFLESWWKKTLYSHKNEDDKGKMESGHMPESICSQGTQAFTRGTYNRFYRSLYTKPNNKTTPSQRLRKKHFLNNVEHLVSHHHQQHQPQDINIDRELNIAVGCLADAYKLLHDISKIYNTVLYREYKVPFYRQSFIYISNELANLIEPLLSQLYLHRRPASSIEIKADPLALEMGTPVHEIYKLIRRIEQLSKGYSFSKDIELQSGFKDYWKWLSKGLKLWLHRTLLRAKRDLIKEIQEETLNLKRCSFSSKSAIEIHDMILNAWITLKWPEEDAKSEWLLRITEVLCSLSLTYCHELRVKIEELNEHSVGHESFRNSIEKRLCYAIANVTEVGEAVKNLPEKKLSSLKGFDQDEEKILCLVRKTYIETNLYSNELMGELIDKVMVKTELCLNQSCDIENISSFEEFLCDDILGKKNFLCENKFKEFLNLFLDGILKVILKIIQENKSKRGHLFFSELFTCFEKCLFRIKFEYPDISCENNESYKRVRQDLSYLKLSSELLVLSYYKERYREQITNELNYYLGQVAVRAFFTMNGTLTVNVILAKDLHVLQSDNLRSLILGRPIERRDQIVSPSSYVVVKVVPPLKTSKSQFFKTKIQKKTSNPVYDSTFEFNLGSTGLNSRNGFLVHSIYNKDCCSVDRLIGEALLPLSEIPCHPKKSCGCSKLKDSSSTSRNCDHPVFKNQFLNLTFPKEFKEYVSLQVLKLRSWDKNTQKLLKEL